MNHHDKRALDILRELGCRPAAPFFEEGPAQFIVDTIRSLGIEVSRDEFGNVIAHYRNLPNGASPRPPIAFVAHMDHPGFEITSAEDGEIVASALGGVPRASLLKPTRVLVLMPDGRRVKAETVPFDSPLPGQERLVGLRLESPEEFDPPVPVVFDLPDYSLDDDTIRMRALDDLAGCGSTLAAFERIVNEKAEADLYAVFTRAEEGGLFGARLMAEAGTLPEDTLVVSIESSPVIPGVAQGDGPVIRTGDRAYTFDGDAEQTLVVASEALKERDRDFRSQRQLMSGGMCEATAFAVFGYKVTGMAFPLGNYHNATTSIPDPDGGVDAEYIQLADYLNGVALLTETAKSVAKRGSSRIREYVRNIPEDVRERMRSTGQRKG